MKENFSTKCGRFMANVFVGCVTVCVSAIFVALTVKFITLIM